MIPILLQNNKTIGVLSDCTRCHVTKERNGIYEAEFDLPIQSDLFKSVQVGCFILAKPDDIDDVQKLRIYKISKPIMGQVTVYCEHIRYQLSGIPVARGTYSGTPAGILAEMLAGTEFSAWSDISAVKQVKVTVPVSIGAMLAGREGSLLDTFGGEYQFDNYTVKLYQHKGQDKALEIRYRKNLTEFTCEVDSTSTYTSVYPFYYSETDDSYVELPNKTISLSNASNLSFSRCYFLDLSADFEEAPTAEQLLTKANAFIRANDLDSIAYHYQISFVPLWQTEEYKHLAVLERCGLCDTVQIVHEELGETVRAKIIKTVYDCLNERYVSMELGNATNNFAQTVAQSVRQVSDSVQTAKSFLQASIDRQTKRITGNRGGYIVMYDSNADGYPDEFLMMNNQTIGAATKMWRANLSGIGYSNHGYTGPFELALTMDGEINASMITTGSLNASIIQTGVLNADLIKAGTIQDMAGNMSINMLTGQIKTSVSSGRSLEIWTNGITMYSPTNEVLASMFVSQNNIGVLTTNRLYVGQRDSEKVELGVDSNHKGYADINGYVRTNTLYADTISFNQNSTINIAGNTSVLGALTVSNVTMYSDTQEVLASMFTSVGGEGIVTANKILVGERNSEKVKLGVDGNNKGYIEIDGQKFAPGTITIDGVSVIILGAA